MGRRLGTYEGDISSMSFSYLRFRYAEHLPHSAPSGHWMPLYCTLPHFFRYLCFPKLYWSLTLLLNLRGEMVYLASDW